MKWIRSEKRLAIYIRDGLACAYCARGIEHGVSLALDHIIPVSIGGSNHENNLVTCCKPCNERRGNRPVLEVFGREGMERTALLRANGIKGAKEIARHILAKRIGFVESVTLLSRAKRG